MATGTVKFFDAEKGFGFIVPDDGSVELFMHKSKMPEDIVGYVKAEARVSYEITERAGKKSASKVSLIAEAPVKPAAPKFKPAPKVEMDFEEAFEREWGLRRAN
ncbi:cold shock domain-containing protein [Agrobacterium rubi]|nr:cold shock domain-containing protein [Agrobacterium rubi]NTF24911.1 cold shock domain-containing protein [Agrobacterium rubi]